MVGEQERLAGVRVQHAAAAVGHLHGNGHNGARAHRDRGWRLDHDPIPGPLPFGRHAKHDRLDRPRGEKLDRDRKRQRGDSLHAAIEALAGIAKPTDNRHTRGDRQQPRAGEGEPDGFGKQRQHQEHDHGQRPAARIERHEQQRQCQREQDFHVHRGNGRILERSAGANLRADHRDVVTKALKPLRDERDFEVLEGRRGR